ncbi:hypothetical protein MUNTM_37470 [Mycobacterium sp. MUNTM1]
MVPKLLVGVAGMAIALGASSGAMASAATDPNPFGHLSCACKDSDPPGSPALRDKIEQGIHQGISSPHVAQ